jgi:hypothetical protein
MFQALCQRGLLNNDVHVILHDVVRLESPVVLTVTRRFTYYSIYSMRSATTILAPLRTFPIEDPRRQFCGDPSFIRSLLATPE